MPKTLNADQNGVEGGPEGGGGELESPVVPDGLSLPPPLPPMVAAATTPPTTTASPNRMRPVRAASSLHADGFSQERLPPVATGDLQRLGDTKATKSPTEENSTPTSAYCSYSVDLPEPTSLGPRGPFTPSIEAQPDNNASDKAPLMILIVFMAV